MPAEVRRRVKANTSPDAPPPGLKPGYHPLETRLAPVGTVDAEARTVEVVFTTGAAVRRRRYDYERRAFVDYDEVLVVSRAAVNLAELKDGAPVLDSHSMWSTDSIRAVVEKAWIEGSEGRALLRFPSAGVDEDADRMFALVRDGIIRRISCGYSTDRVRVEPPKKDGDVERRVIERWTPKELSFVTIAADPGAKVRSEGGEDEVRIFPITINRAQPKAKEVIMDDDDVKTGETEAPETATRAAPAETASTTQAQTSARPAADPDAVRNAVDAEMARRDAIENLARRHGLGDDFIKKHRDAKATVDQVREAVLDELARRDSADVGHTQVTDPAVTVTRSAEDKFVEGAMAAIITRAGQAPLLQQAAGKEGKPLDPGNYRSYRMVDLAREFLELRGHRTRGLGPDQIVRTAITLRSAGVGYGAQGTSDFGTLLENTMHKVLLGAYAVTPDVWSRFCKTGSVSDFRAHNRYRLGSFGALDTLNEHGEFKHKTIPDGEKYTIQARTRGNKIGLSRQAIIDDDLGAFSDLATMFGRAAKLSIEMDVFDLLALNSGMGPNLADGDPLFHSNHANVAMNGAISVDVFDDVDVKMGSQRDVSGNEVLDLRPAVLLVPKGSAGDARVINGAEYDPDTSGKLQKPNKVRGLFRDIVSTARLSGTRFYAFAEPSIAPVIEVAFLNGQMEPFLDSKEGWTYDGVEWKVRLDYGVAAQDYRGAVTGDGASGG